MERGFALWCEGEGDGGEEKATSISEDKAPASEAETKREAESWNLYFCVYTGCTLLCVLIKEAITLYVNKKSLVILTWFFSFSICDQ